MAVATRLAVLASGQGSNLRALIDAHARGDLPCPIVLVVSNNSRSGALALAAERAIATAHVSSKTHADPGAGLLELLERHRVEGIVLAGYMKLLDPRIVRRFEGRVVNVHPAPLPRFGGPGMFGDRVHAAVLAAGCESSGPTFHLVDEVYDHGRPIAHVPVPVLTDDDVQRLRDRVQAAEHEHFWRVLRDHFAGSVERLR